MASWWKEGPSTWTNQPNPGVFWACPLLEKKRKSKQLPDAQCMVYLPTFTLKTAQIVGK